MSGGSTRFPGPGREGRARLEGWEGPDGVYRGSIHLLPAARAAPVSAAPGALWYASPACFHPQPRQLQVLSHGQRYLIIKPDEDIP